MQHTRPFPSTVLGTAAAATAATARADDDRADKLRKLIEPLPTPEHDVAENILEEILAGGADTIAQLALMTGQQFGDKDGVKPKYALHGLVHYVCRQGAEKQRKLVAETLAELLDDDHSDELKAFLCRQLQLCGRDEEVPALAALLESDRLCEPATQALGAIGSDKAAAALRTALPASTGGRRTTLVNALGRLHDAASAKEIREDLDAKDEDLRVVTQYALGNMADAGAAEALLKAAGGEPGYERTQVTDACLRLARGLAADGKTADAESICRKLMKMRAADDEAHERCAVLACLGDVLGAKALDDFTAALASKNAWLRKGAARNAVDLGRAIAGDHPQEARALLKKAIESTDEEAVHADAQVILLDL
jgi:hypothetical protein